MSSLVPPTLVALSVITTALAQILLKKGSAFAFSTPTWTLFTGLSAGFYLASFIMYTQMLRYYPLNKVYPATTVAQIVLIAAYGLAIGEVIDAKQALGLTLGLVAVYLILS